MYAPSPKPYKESREGSATRKTCAVCDSGVGYRLGSGSKDTTRVVLYMRVPFRVLFIRVPYFIGDLKNGP